MSDDPMLTGLINASAKEQQYGGTPARFCESLVLSAVLPSPAPPHPQPRCPRAVDAEVLCSDVLFAFCLLSFNQCLFWITFSPIASISKDCEWH